MKFYTKPAKLAKYFCDDGGQCTQICRKLRFFCIKVILEFSSVNKMITLNYLHESKIQIQITLKYKE